MKSGLVILEKKVGETPLVCLENYRNKHRDLQGVPMAYAGRLDPLASGKLLVLFGDECKRQKEYHGLDKEYLVDVAFGIGSDTGDVMGRLSFGEEETQLDEEQLSTLAQQISGTTHVLKYPPFSSKTVHGKPLHTWTCEGRLHEIIIPEYTAKLHRVEFMGATKKTGVILAESALAKINTIPPVADTRKSLGNDFRRTDIRADWNQFMSEHGSSIFTIATFRIGCGSGVYMRSLAHEIAVSTFCKNGIATAIHRTRIGMW